MSLLGSIFRAVFTGRNPSQSAVNGYTEAEAAADALWAELGDLRDPSKRARALYALTDDYWVMARHYRAAHPRDLTGDATADALLDVGTVTDLLGAVEMAVAEGTIYRPRGEMFADPDNLEQYQIVMDALVDLTRYTDLTSRMAALPRLRDALAEVGIADAALHVLQDLPSPGMTGWRLHSTNRRPSRRT